MARKLPPLTTLPAFDAAARHLNFTKAAAELYLTHGAVSRAIRNLEEVLGAQLFERRTRSVRLTAEGAAYAAEIGPALDRIGAATIVASATRSANVLTVSTSDGFAGRWLVPRLHRFHRTHRDLDVRLSTSGTLSDFVRDGIDIAVRYGAGGYEGVKSELLAEEYVSPVCSPELLGESIRCGRQLISSTTGSFMTTSASAGPTGCRKRASPMSMPKAASGSTPPFSPSRRLCRVRVCFSAGVRLSPLI